MNLEAFEIVGLVLALVAAWGALGGIAMGLASDEARQAFPLLVLFGPLTGPAMIAMAPVQKIARREP